MIAFIRRLWPGALLLIALALMALVRRHDRADGAASERIAALTVQRDEARVAALAVRTEFIHTADTLVRVIDRSGAVTDSARQVVRRAASVADSLRARVGFMASDSARADSALVFTLAQNDTLRATVLVVAAQRDTLAAAGERAIAAARGALVATDTLSALNERIAQATAAHRCRFCPSRRMALVAGLVGGWYLHERLTAHR